MTAVLSKDWRPDDRVLHVGHEKYSVLTEMGQGKLMGSIHCTWIPFILVVISQSHLPPLSGTYSANPPIDPTTHIGTGTVELFLCHDSHDPLCLPIYVLCLVLFFVTITPYHTFLSQL